jgi:hypothetical protein
MIAHASSVVDAETDFIDVNPTRKSDNFTMIENALLRNKSLSFKARGILCHLLSHRAGWKIRMSELRKDCVDGEAAIRSGIDELVRAGYMTRERVRGDSGRMLGWRYRVFEEPVPTDTRFSSIGFSSIGKSSAKNTKGKKTKGEEEVGLLRKPTAPADAGCDSSADTGMDPEELASYLQTTTPGTKTEAQADALLLKSEDDPGGKDFPWRPIMAAMRRILPELELPTKGDRRDVAMKLWWRSHGKTVGAFEMLAEKVRASDYLMARNGHEGRNGRPFPWSWIFAKDRQGRLRATRIMEDAFTNEAMAFVLEKKSAAKLTKVMLTSSTAPVEVDLAEKWQGEPRYRVVGTHANGCPEVIDYRD